MEQIEFTTELLKIAFAATVCDGDIDDLEMEIIYSLEKEDFYLKEVDLRTKIDEFLKLAEDNYKSFAKNTVNETYRLQLSPAEKMVIVKMAISIVRADGKMQSD